MNELKTKRLATIKQMASLYPAFTESSLRWLVFNERTNQFGQCLRRVGRRVLVDLDSFERWVDGQGGAR